MKTKYTPGPWKADSKHNGNGYYDVKDKRGNPVANVWENYRCDNGDIKFVNAKANAKLISAAPEMLFALEQCLELFEADLPPTLKNLVTNALKKAKGK